MIPALMLGFASGPADAAPQVLGLMASNGSVPLACDGDSCGAIAGTFCLQRWRSMPTYGAAYAPADPAHLRLVVMTADGESLDLPIPSDLAFASYDGYWAIEISLPAATLASLGGTGAAVMIDPGASLVPIPVAGDADPQDPDEIDLATGAMRTAAARYLDGTAPETDAARLIAALINGLPERHTIRDDNGGLWDRTVAAVPPLNPAAMPVARAAYDRCVGQSHLRRCLEARHREIMQPLNHEFWESTGGS
jgi:hypothetical protein